jgi:hypothetical protein
MKKLLLAALVITVTQLAGYAQEQKQTTNAPATNDKQADKAQKYVSTDGITIPDDAEEMPKGNFMVSAFAGQTTTASLAGKTVNALLQSSGNAKFTKEGKLARGTEKFKPTQIMTSKKNEVWIDISSCSISKDGFLVVSDKSGATYKIALGPNYDGTIEEIEKTAQDKK